MIPTKSKLGLIDLLIALSAIPILMEDQRKQAGPAPKPSGTPAVESDEEISAVEHVSSTAPAKLFGAAVPAAEAAAQAAAKTESQSFNFGAKVKILHRAQSGERGWLNHWMLEMDSAVGKTGIVIDDKGAAGVLIAVEGLNNFFCYPRFALEKVSAAAVEPFEFIRNGSLFRKDGDELFIMANVDTGKYALISLRNGNRWSKPTDTPEAAFNGKRSRFVKEEGALGVAV